MGAMAQGVARGGVEAAVLERFMVRVVEGARFRVPSRRGALRALVSGLKWLCIYGVFDAALALGRHTPFGVGLTGLALVPLFVAEAWVSARSRWPTRLLQMLGFALPMFTHCAFWSVVPATCCFCDHSFWAKMLRNLEWVSDFLYLNAVATLPAYVVLILLRRTAAPPAERDAYVRATFTGVLASLSVMLPFVAVFFVLKSELSAMP